MASVDSGSLPARSARGRAPASRPPARRGGRALVASDAVALVLGALVAAGIALGREGDATAVLALSLAWAPVVLLLARAHGLYATEETALGHSTLDDLVPTVQAATMGAWTLFLLTQLVDLPLAAGDAVAYWLCALVALPVFRAVTRTAVRRDARYAERVVIVGAGTVAVDVAARLARHGGVDVVGFVDRAPMHELLAADGPPLLGSPEDIPGLVRTLAIGRVIVAFSADSHEETLELLRALADLDVRVDVVPRLFEVIGANVHVHSVAGLPLLGLPSLRLSRPARFVKRALDLALAVPALVLLAPLFGVVALVVKLDSRGPAFFRQVRRGEGERTFRIVKFRTMTVDAEERKDTIRHLNIHSDRDPRMFKVADDPRITRVGRLLRRTSLDELPQLWNVVRGDMSLVGPRPLILEEDQHVRAWARKRLALKPGITGLWQVLGRSDIPFEEMVKLDYLYVTNWSVGQDIRLIGLTVPALLRARRAL